MLAIAPRARLVRGCEAKALTLIEAEAGWPSHSRPPCWPLDPWAREGPRMGSGAFPTGLQPVAALPNLWGSAMHVQDPLE